MIPNSMHTTVKDNNNLLQFQHDLDTVAEWSNVWQLSFDFSIGVARGGHGREFALPSVNFALPSKPSFYLYYI